MSTSDLGEILIRSHVGSHARVRRYDRTLRTPMNFVIDIALDQLELSAEPVIYWVDEGLPEIFSQPDLDPPGVVYSTRYLEVSAIFRGLLRNDLARMVLDPERLAERVCLKVLAELSLRYGEPGLAAYLMTRSLLDQRDYLLMQNVINELEVREKDEQYMTVWFFGLLHELGHVSLASNANMLTSIRPESLANEVSQALADLLAGEDLERIGTSLIELNEAVDIELLREEVACDMLAAHVLLAATREMMQLHQEKLRILPLVYEIHLALNLVTALDFSRSIIRESQVFPPKVENVVRHLVAPAVFRVRVENVINYLAAVLAANVDQPEEAYQEVRTEMMDACATANDLVSRMENGQTRAFRQILFPGERVAGLTPRLVESMAGPSGVMAQIELSNFCKLAESLGIEHPDIQYLHELSRARNEVPEPPTRQYAVLWMDGDGGYSYPMLLNTVYGPLSLIFEGALRENGITVSDDFKAYYRVCESELPSGFRIRPVVVQGQFEQDVVAFVAKGIGRQTMHRALIAVEGTSRFSRIMEDLEVGALWR